jgi:hypothetical protein
MLAGLIGTTPIDVARSDPGTKGIIILLIQPYRLETTSNASCPLGIDRPTVAIGKRLRFSIDHGPRGRRTPFYAERWQRAPQHQELWAIVVNTLGG